ncbi:MAG: hypothetical protein IBJ10_01470 [Phycisphaerales bacterium]|nr:hypothetical protein [Phycisphaerales bacterium]
MVFGNWRGGLGAAVVASSALAGAPSYSLVGSFTTPDGAGARTLTSDGRMLTMVGADVFLQDAPLSGSFTRLGGIDASLLNSFGASCVALSPDGSTLAIGDGNFGPGSRVHFVSFADLNGGGAAPVWSVDAASYEAHWHADGRLFLSGADFTDSFVSVVEGVERGGATVRRVVENIVGASAGVTVRDGWVYTANGFDFDPGSGSGIGDVRAFDLGMLGAGGSFDFESDGVLVASALSGLSLGFDGAGNMLIGGGDFGDPAQFGFAAVVDGGAISAALMGLGPAGDADELRLSPAGQNTYSILFNGGTQELLVWGFGDGLVHRYAVPTPGGVACVGLMMGLAAGRRRRG